MSPPSPKISIRPSQGRTPPRSIREIRILLNGKCVKTYKTKRVRNNITVRRDCRKWIRDRMKLTNRNYAWYGYDAAGDLVISETVVKVCVQWQVECADW